ncbi:MAG: hypothetical protein ABH829_00525 [archaeon]
MRKQRIAFCTIVLLLAFSMPALAAAQEVKVGTYILNIGEYDIEKGAYKADFYLWFKWDGELSPEGFELMNGDRSSSTKIIDEPGYLFYRIRANLHENPDLHLYPKDTQSLTIKIEDSMYNSKQLVYVPDYEEIGMSGEVEIRNWDIVDAEARVKENYYPNWKENYSRYTYEVRMGRPSSAYWRIILPILFVAITAWACFLLPVHKIEAKLALGGTALLSAVVLHILIIESIPPIGYLTLADRYIIALYSLLVFSLVSMIMVERHLLKERHKEAARDNLRFALGALAVPAVMFFLLTLL